jgi:succinate-semialdehyde dehydrogenase/glutarate-semialdehyde dehydrogenase
MEFKSLNPYNGQTVATYRMHSESETMEKLRAAEQAFKSWRGKAITERALLFQKLAARLRSEAERCATLITLEMGKPIRESRAEVEKCAWVCAYYAENAAAFMARESINTEASASFVRHDPLGVLLAIMPWNFPFWQVFRFAAPSLMAGNVALLKHAPNVTGCASFIEQLFVEVGFPAAVFQHIRIEHEAVEAVIAHPAVKAVSLTGSERAGSTVAALAGKYIKKTVLELGGSNAFIVCADADIEQAVKTAVTARMMNAGQSCIAAKRFIVEAAVYDEFVERFVEETKKLKTGNPLDEDTALGPLARRDLADQLQRQLQESLNAGASLLYGGEQEGCFHEPTVIADVHPGMAAFDEETFGPLAVMIKVKDLDAAFALAQQSKYGLGLTICTKDTERALAKAGEVEDGAYFINELVKSDPRLPFGGTKQSGYGRELSKDGLLEFVNRKVVYVK